MLAALASPCRIKRKRHRWRRIASGRTVYGYVGGNPLGGIDPTGRNCVAANGQVTCSTPYGTLPPFAQPSGWPSTMNSNSSFHHTYDIKVPLNGANKDCVMNGMINNPTPGSPSPATPQGTVNNATPTGAQNLFNDLDYVSSFGSDSGGYNNSPVKSYVMNLNGSQVVVNVTLPGHPLFPGYVVRSIQGSNVSNYGEGNGWLQGSWSPLAGSINGVWNGQTTGITCGCHN
jgi:hypothetical protein